MIDFLSSDDLVASCLSVKTALFDFHLSVSANGGAPTWLFPEEVVALRLDAYLQNHVSIVHVVARVDSFNRLL
ncbi:hypothetical protein N665_0211s0039 [Sinapis alba]|nr:hypothetical protein N665_0211s0039 [Sinapis alba]